jgi:hypothetical protein
MSSYSYISPSFIASLFTLRFSRSYSPILFTKYFSLKSSILVRHEFSATLLCFRPFLLQLAIGISTHKL